MWQMSRSSAAALAGLSAARRLKQNDPTLKIVLVEARQIAHGPAGRNSGFMIDSAPRPFLQ